ncbi:LEAF RUST 10 DISEASE-RESISTANCE LOCUS RECEPTOR-LIKE PROTEIN KINASE-like 2.4 [Tasmannia lanceolata]|uniref:LEAF RUST 10 DISEASE-RESISTANCE LOCUS RECEPTOR-LIKE PROTEIN KINASE-like 2.4 n=1 Tax=Tasmannia lanceolata TaxID=3420 RepID=UPI0040647BD6
MKSKFLSIARLPSLLPIFFFLVGSNAIRDDCHSTCGTLQNITYPFRLTTDPKDCGVTQYELACQNNRTFLYLKSSKYYVEEILYEKQFIRLVDSGLQKDNCTSLPLHPSPIDNLRNDDPYQFLYNTVPYPEPIIILFVKCSVPMTSSLYKATKCFNTSVQDNLYVIVDDATLSDLHTSCKAVLNIPVLRMPRDTEKENYSKIHDLFLMGFELSWKEYLSCIDPMGKGTPCSLYASHYTVALVPYKWRPDGSPCTSTCRTPIQSPKCFFFHFIPCLIYALLFYMRHAMWYAIIVLLPARTLIGVICVAIFLAYKLRTRHIWMDDTIEEFLSKHRCQTPTRYSYSDIKKMTQGFKEKLGQGGYGSVYRGKLRSGHLVAVKMLANSKGNGQDFMNEISTIGRIHHVNVVPLIGFCSEGSNRALIYDFMPNGSLEKYIFPQQGSINPLSWERTYQIAIGIARGIEYLHRGCDMRILHFDIKPHNILLDENYIPKVSDFGLAKFYPTGASIVSVTAARGTLGYMAPELFYKNLGGVSYKSDVYSFGMLLMEMAGRRSNFNEKVENSSQTYFPSWIYNQINQGNDMELGNTTDGETEIAKRLIIVALWCIQLKPADRPSMGKVLEMLEGSIELLQIPPKPFLSSPTRATGEDDATEMDCMGSSTISEYWSDSQDQAESSLLHV